MTTGPRIVVLGTDAAFARAVCDVLSAQIPGAAPDSLEPSRVRVRPEASAVVIDARSDVAGGAALAERLRAMGFSSAIVLLAAGAEATEGADATAAGDSARRMGAALLSPDLIPTHLVSRLAELMAAAGTPHAEQVMAARRLVTAGQIAKGLQHALNNPIAGIMAEAQLMQFESVTAEQAEALARIVELCRRLSALTRSLDGLGDRKTARPDAGPVTTG